MTSRSRGFRGQGFLGKPNRDPCQNRQVVLSFRLLFQKKAGSGPIRGRVPNAATGERLLPLARMTSMAQASPLSTRPTGPGALPAVRLEVRTPGGITIYDVGE